MERFQQHGSTPPFSLILRPNGGVGSSRPLPACLCSFIYSSAFLASLPWGKKQSLQLASSSKLLLRCLPLVLRDQRQLVSLFSPLRVWILLAGGLVPPPPPSLAASVSFLTPTEAGCLPDIALSVLWEINRCSAVCGSLWIRNPKLWVS